MTTKSTAARLVDALLKNCSGIQYDYNVKTLEGIFDEVLQTSATDPHQENFHLTF